LPKKKETTATTITAPIIDGTIAIPANLGPHVPNNPCPTADPTNPAIIFAIHPIAFPLLVIAPAIKPIRAPIINDQIIFNSFLYAYYTKNVLAFLIQIKSYTHFYQIILNYLKFVINIFLVLC